jgi:hypothetical protein
VDLARERLANGEAVTEEDLALVERGLQRMAAAVQRAEAAARAVPKEGAR